MNLSELIELASVQLALAVQWLVQLSGELEEQLSPLLVSLQLVWEDPLWQALITIFLVVLVLLVGLWLFKRGVAGVIGLFGGLLAIIKKLFQFVASPLQSVKQLLAKLKQSIARKTRNKMALSLRMQRIVDSLKYLTTSRDWRYNNPWYLILGESHSNATALLKGIITGRRAAILSREKLMQVAGSRWHFFDHGIVINPQDPLLLPPDKGTDNHTLANKLLVRLLELIHRYRPERALDGVVLCVSVKSLLAFKDNPLELTALGERLFQQLWTTQKQSAFVLPVYLLLTECEAISGFDAYWQAQPPERLKEIFGWSNPNDLNSNFNLEWIDQAFSQINVALQQAQIQVAATNNEIEKIDDFMLFHQYFQLLLAPLRQVVDSALSPARFQASVPLRGIYCSGKVSDKMAFADELFNKKIFTEINLAVPIERRLLSSERSLRRFQLTTLGFCLVALIWLCVDVVRMNAHNANQQRVLRQIMNSPNYKTRINGALDCSPTGLNSYRLLAALDEVGDHPSYYSMPAAMVFDSQFEEVQDFVANELLAPHLFASLDCRLKYKLDELSSWAVDHPLDAISPQDLSANLLAYSQAMARLHKEHDDFLFLIGPLGSDKKVAIKLKGLLDYLYDSPTPKEAIPKKPLVTEAVKVMVYDVKAAAMGKSSTFKPQRNIDYLRKLAMRTNAHLIHQTDFTQSGTPLLKQQDDQKGLLLTNLHQLGQWVSEMNRQWTVPYASSPCGQFDEQLTEAINVLDGSAYYNHNELESIRGLFSQQQCYRKAREQLSRQSAPPFGQIFQEIKGELLLSPDVPAMLVQINDMQKLSFMQGPANPVTRSYEPVTGWSTDGLAAALQGIREYQKFAASYWQDKESSFAPALKQRLSLAIHRDLQNAMLNPSETGKAGDWIGTPIDKEASLSKQVMQFNQVKGSLVALDQLLSQLGDEQNRVWLRQSARNFAKDRLEELDALVKAYGIYQSKNAPRWQERASFAQALFDKQSNKQVEQYTLSMRQSLAQLTYSYAQPLLDYLYNSGGVDSAGSSAQRWLATLSTLSDFERKLDDTDLNKLEAYINVTLASGRQQICPTPMQTDADAVGGSWFAERFVQLDRQVWLHCKSDNVATAMDDFMAFAKRFDEQLGGRFPFAELANAGQNEVSLSAVQIFFNQANNDPANLLAKLSGLKQTIPGAVPQAWLEFLNQLQGFRSWLRQGLSKDLNTWAAPLEVNFQALPEYAQGTDQIIRWTVSNGQQQSVFPNQDQPLIWQLGQPLWLELQWAESSAYLPYAQAVMPSAIQIPQQRSVRFVTKGQWGMFEWLQRYANKLPALGKALSQGTELLSFSVPVALKAAPLQSQSPAYVSQAILSINATYVDKQGLTQAIVWPVDLPHRAPGLNE